MLRKLGVVTRRSSSSSSGRARVDSEFQGFVDRDVVAQAVTDAR